MRKVMVAVLTAVSLSTLFACKNEGYETCMKQVNEYEQGKITCLAMPDKTQRDACVDKNEVKKITSKDCADIHK